MIIFCFHLFCISVKLTNFNFSIIKLIYQLHKFHLIINKNRLTFIQTDIFFIGKIDRVLCENYKILPDEI